MNFQSHLFLLFRQKNSKLKCSLYMHFSIFGSSTLLHSRWCSLQRFFALFHFEGFPKVKLSSWNEDDESVCGDCCVGVRCNPRRWERVPPEEGKRHGGKVSGAGCNDDGDGVAVAGQ